MNHKHNQNKKYFNCHHIVSINKLSDHNCASEVWHDRYPPSNYSMAPWI